MSWVVEKLLEFFHSSKKTENRTAKALQREQSL